MQIPEINDERRGNSEIDEIGKTIELGSEARSSLKQAGDTAIDAIE